MSDIYNSYRIGKVSTITGITPDTLRIWERRYSVVQPQRTQAGGRLYDSDDIARLKLIKTLVDSGDSISNLASLSHQQLQSRIAESQHPLATLSPDNPLRLCVIGASITAKIKSSEDELDGFDIAASYQTIQSLKAANETLKVDIVIIELSTLHRETAGQIISLINHLNAAHAIVIYRFSAAHALSLLSNSKISLLRAPVDLITLRKICLSLVQQTLESKASLEQQKLDRELNYAPPRRFDDDALSRVASLSPALQCECPHHLAELLSSLAAFEKYSSECENRNQQDAELHTYLSKTTSHARHMIEDALEMVLEIENIEINR